MHGDRRRLQLSEVLRRRPCLDQLQPGLEILTQTVGGSDQLGSLDSERREMTTLKASAPIEEVGCSLFHQIEILQFGSGVVSGTGDHHCDNGGGGDDRGPEETAEGPSARLLGIENHGARLSGQGPKREAYADSDRVPGVAPASRHSSRFAFSLWGYVSERGSDARSTWERSCERTRSAGC